MTAFNFDPFPLLTTNNYVLRRLVQLDAPAVFILRTDEDVNRHLGRQKASSIDDILAFIQKINESIAKGESYYWAICKHDDAALLGTICLFNINSEKSTAEIGYELLPAFQGKGIFKEVMPSVISFVFENIGLKIIEACVAPANISSIKLLEKHGFAAGGLVEDGALVCYQLKNV